MSGPRCGRCAASLPPALPHGGTCAACRIEPPPFARLLARADYDAVRDWILPFKHGGRRDLTELLGALMVEGLAGELAHEDRRLVVPVPLHPLRRIERGYDQAGLLGRDLARRLDLLFSRPLVRTRATPPQGAPGSVSRRANVRGAFALADRRARVEVANRTVLLVDDVATSGTTLAEAARVLRRAGAARIDAVCLARAGSLREEPPWPRLPPR